jgi:CRISPR-associated endonuclease/helicase Cas3
LAPENQAVLAGLSKKGLPVRHEDAGAACLLENRREKAALLVVSHHAGLPSVPREEVKVFQKGPRQYRITEAIGHTDQHLAEYSQQYDRAGSTAKPGPTATERWAGLTHRFALSCLVDADHTDTARHYRQAVPKRPAKCNWAARLEALDRFVSDLSAKRAADPRNEDRRRVYEDCRNTKPETGIVSCDAAVGSGKTTAVMAYLLRVAAENKLRHIFVVLPYTNIIQQSVDVYRKALVLPDEDPAEVVAEVHHRAEFANPESREMSVLWDAPITVTTAVQFFETLAANKPARLRKLHELAGSAVFVDEAHAAIPIWLWPQTWLWLKELAEEWGCHFVLASGSLARFWENPSIVPASEKIPDLLTPATRSRLALVEEGRIVVRKHPGLLSCEGVSQFVAGKEGPRLAILNTVQSAAVLADFMRTKGHHVMHLSTALTPEDRERVVQRVKARLKHQSFANWTLVATSCVEAGVDFSFRTAIRESSSVASVIQTGGRVNRHGEWAAAEVWDVCLQDPAFNHHPAFDSSRRVLKEMLEEGQIDSSVVTEALRRELILKDVGEKVEDLRKSERVLDFPRVAELYQVIDSDTRTVVVDPGLVERLKAGERVPARELLRGSVQIWKLNIEKLRIRQFEWDEELYYWTGPYDPDFLGYMEGVLPLIHGRVTGLFS